MKKHNKKLLPLLLAGCIAFGGCGAAGADAPKEAEGNTEAEENTETQEPEENTDSAGNPDAAEPEQPAEGTEESTEKAAGSSTFNTTFPSASVDPVIPPPLVTPDTESRTNGDNGETHNIVGIITDATPYSVSIQVPDGSFYYMTIPETGVTGNLNSVTIGQLATLTYTGSLDENHASLVGISSSSMITGIYLEEYAFAIKIINAARAMDLVALSNLMDYPVFFETYDYKGTVNTVEDFRSINNERIFTEELVTRLADYNLFDLKYTDAGFVMGDGTPSLTFDVDDDGILGIVGINSGTMPEKDTSEKQE